MCCWQTLGSNPFFSHPRHCLKALALQLQHSARFALLRIAQVDWVPTLSIWRAACGHPANVLLCPRPALGIFFGTSTGREPPARNQLGIVLLAPPGGPNLAQVLRLGCRVTALGVVFVFRGLQARTLVDSSRVKKAASMNAAFYHSPPSWSFLQQKQCAFQLAQTVVSGTMGPWLFQPIYRLHLHAFTVGFSKTPRLMLTSEQLINPSPIIR